MSTISRRVLLVGLAYAVASVRNSWRGGHTSAARAASLCNYKLKLGNWYAEASDQAYGASLIQDKFRVADVVSRQIAGVRDNKPDLLQIHFTARTKFDVKDIKEEWDGDPVVVGTVRLGILTEHDSKRHWVDADLEAYDLAPSTPKIIEFSIPTAWFRRSDDSPSRVVVQHKGEPLLLLELDDGFAPTMWLAKREKERLAASAQKGECQTYADCFVTSACVDEFGLADDCFELRALRKFRDHWLASRPWGPRQIALYYEVAPAIVSAMRSQPNDRVLIDVYVRYVLPAAFFAHLGLDVLAYKRYSTMMVGLIERYQSTIRSQRRSNANRQVLSSQPDPQCSTPHASTHLKSPR